MGEHGGAKMSIQTLEKALNNLEKANEELEKKQSEILRLETPNKVHGKKMIKLQNQVELYYKEVCSCLNVKLNIVNVNNNVILNDAEFKNNVRKCMHEFWRAYQVQKDNFRKQLVNKLEMKMITGRSFALALHGSTFVYQNAAERLKFMTDKKMLQIHLDSTKRFAKMLAMYFEDKTPESVLLLYNEKRNHPYFLKVLPVNVEIEAKKGSEAVTPFSALTHTLVHPLF